MLCLYYSAKLRVFKCFCLWHLFGSVREEKNLFSLDQCFGYSLPVKTSSAILCAPHWPVHLKFSITIGAILMLGCFHEPLFRTASNPRLCVQWSLHNAIQFRPTTYKYFAKRLPNKKGKKIFSLSFSNRFKNLRVLADSLVTF